MSILNFKPALWEAEVLRTLEDNLVAQKICNKDYTGEIKKAGDRVYFTGLADPAIGNYTGASAMSYEALVDAGLALIVDTQKYYAFQVDDIDAAQAKGELKNSQIKRAAHLLAKEVDKSVFGLYAQAAANSAAITDANCDEASIIGAIAELNRALLENNVPANQMWLAIPPWVQMKLQLAGIKFSINEGINGTGGIGYAKELGFDIFVSNNVYNSATAAAPASSVLAGSYNAIGFADQLSVVEAMRLEGYFADGCRGLYTYGTKVLKPKELALATLTYSANII